MNEATLLMFKISFFRAVIADLEKRIAEIETEMMKGGKKVPIVFIEEKSGAVNLTTQGEIQ